MSPVATDGKDRNGLKLEKIGLISMLMIIIGTLCFETSGLKDSFMMKVLQSDATDISTLLVLFYVKVCFPD